MTVGRIAHEIGGRLRLLVSSRATGPRLVLRRLTSGPAEAKLNRAETKKPGTDRVSARPTREAIARRAHQIYLERGAAPGHALDDWLQAERELSGRRA
jgi:hypothetical protein